MVEPDQGCKDLVVLCNKFKWRSKYQHSLIIEQSQNYVQLQIM